MLDFNRFLQFSFALPLAALVIVLRPAIAGSLPEPVPEAAYRPYSEAGAQLGRLLFYDPILSGNRNIACATCHHHDFASADGLSLSVGEGGVGLGPKRDMEAAGANIERRVPRHSPALFNLGAEEFTHLFHDGRLSVDPGDPSGFDSPAAEFLPDGLQSVVAAQAMFPLTSETEMAGDETENEVGAAAKARLELAWRNLAQRLRDIPDYVALFRQAYPGIRHPSQITMVHAANAIGDFISSEWRADNSRFDRYLRGDRSALDAGELRGMELFYGAAGCAACHSGPFQTDHDFHAIAMPQFGPGRTRKMDPSPRDLGRLNETDAIADRYKFRTPSLRNVVETAPYGHTGAYRTLVAVIRHHLNPVASLRAYDRGQVLLPVHTRSDATDFILWQDEREMAALAAANELNPRPLSATQIQDLIAFLGALTDTESLNGRLGKPDAVPSGLPLDQ